MSSFVGCGMMGPVSHPGPLSLNVSIGRFVLGTIIVELSCCAAYSLYGNALSTHTPYSSDVGWFICVVQVRPVSEETFAPPSFDWIMIPPLVGLIHMSWLSPCGVRKGVTVFPPSRDR